VTAGSAAVGEIVFAPEPIAKRIVSAPAAALAALIASRSVQLRGVAEAVVGVGGRVDGARSAADQPTQRERETSTEARAATR
jgi:hypothetical protein